MLRYGESGLLIEFTSAAQVTIAYRRLHDARADGRLPGVVELVPAAQTVLVRGESGAPPAALLADVLADIAEQARRPSPHTSRSEVVIPVHYDGADLDLVARTAELSVPEVVELHSGAAYTVAFCGFSPGYGYLVGLPQPLQQARLADSRPKVPAGSVGVAGTFTGVYPRSSPGGWRLIGHTDEIMFDPGADPPSRLAPGDRVRFVPVR
ncbi:MAG: allophanate hydrolase subunit 1 [Pseudonocardia sp.]|nr:allophanate hydrolase subunit 1 [Pseudonocardia sp.]